MIVILPATGPSARNQAIQQTINKQTIKTSKLIFILHNLFNKLQSWITLLHKKVITALEFK